MNRSQQILNAISSPTRLRILAALADGGLDVNAITGATGNTQPNISTQCNILEAAGLIESNRSGKRVVKSMANCVTTRGSRKPTAICIRQGELELVIPAEVWA